jgi:hypothetical protein
VALWTRSFRDRRAALLACFALPTLAMMLVVSFLSRAHPNWAAPTYVSATVLVVAWLIARGRAALVTASVVLNVVLAVAAFGAHDILPAFGIELPVRYDPLHRLRGWRTLGRSVGMQLALHPGTHLMTDDREVTAALIYYVEPHPFDALKWNGEGGVHDEFDLTAEPQRYIGDNFLLVAKSSSDVKRILARFKRVDPTIQEVLIPLDRGTLLRFRLYWLQGFEGYPSPAG